MLSRGSVVARPARLLVILSFGHSLLVKQVGGTIFLPSQCYSVANNAELVYQSAGDASPAVCDALNSVYACTSRYATEVATTTLPIPDSIVGSCGQVTTTAQVSATSASVASTIPASVTAVATASSSSVSLTAVSVSSVTAASSAVSTVLISVSSALSTSSPKAQSQSSSSVASTMQTPSTTASLVEPSKPKVSSPSVTPSPSPVASDPASVVDAYKSSCYSAFSATNTSNSFYSGCIEYGFQLTSPNSTSVASPTGSGTVLPSSPHPISKGVIAGIVVGAFAAGILLLLGLIWFIRRQRRNSNQRKATTATTGLEYDHGQQGGKTQPHELYAAEYRPYHGELEGSGVVRGAAARQISGLNEIEYTPMHQRVTSEMSANEVAAKEMYVGGGTVTERSSTLRDSLPESG